MGKEWEDSNPGQGDRITLGDLVALADKKQFTKKHRAYRFIGQITSFVEIWLPIYKDGKPVISDKTNKPVRIPKYATNYDPDTEEHTTTPCPYLELAEKMNPYLSEKQQLKPKKTWLSNAIDRVAQESPPRRMPNPLRSELKSGFKSMESESWTPVVVLPMTGSLAKKTKALISLNKVRNKETGETKTYSIAHPRYGVDVNVIYDPDETGGAMYNALPDQKTKLTEEEQGYLIFDIDNLVKPDKLSDAKTEANRLWVAFSKGNPLIKGSKSEPEDLEDDDEDYLSKKKKRRVSDDDDDDDPKPAKKKRPVDDDEDEPKPKKKKPLADDDDDDEPVVKKKKRPVDDDDDEPKPKKKKRSIDDDDELGDLSNLDDDDDDEPKPKKKRPVYDDDDDDEPAAKPKRRVAVEEDEDDEPKAKKKKRPVDDDDDEDEPKPKKPLADDDDDDEPKKKKRGVPFDVDDDDDEAPVTRKKKPVDDDDEDEPPSKSKKSSETSTKKKKRPADDEDDD